MQCGLAVACGGWLLVIRLIVLLFLGVRSGWVILCGVLAVNLFGVYCLP